MSGSNQERELAKRAYDSLGYQTMRSPSSGSAPRPQPDVLMVRDGGGKAVELKSSTSRSTANRVYYTEEELEALGVFAEAGGFEPMAGGRFSGDRNIYLVPPEALEETDDNGQGDDDKTTYVLTHERAKEICEKSPGAYAVVPADD